MACSAAYRRIVSGESRGIGADLARGVFRALSVPYGATGVVIELFRTGQGGVRVGLPVV